MTASQTEIPVAATDSTTMFARTVLGIAAQVEAAENEIKEALMAAARAGDTDRVLEILSRWRSLPAVEVLGRETPRSSESACTMRGT